MEELVLAMLLALPGPAPKQSETISIAIAEASDGDKRLAAELVALGHFESGYLDRIQEGKCRKHECDRGRARSYWQFQKTSYSRDAWETSVGLDYEAILEACVVASNVLRAGHRACGSTGGALSFYAVGHCGWKGGDRRAVLVNRLMAVK